MTSTPMPDTMKGREHTPIPWTVDPEFEDQAVIGPDGVQVADCSITCHPKFGKRNDVINAANAEFIVRAVNAHDDLVKALEAARGYIQAKIVNLPRPQRDGSRENSVLKQINAALSRQEAQGQ